MTNKKDADRLSSTILGLVIMAHLVECSMCRYLHNKGRKQCYKHRNWRHLLGSTNLINRTIHTKEEINEMHCSD